ncbi:hypothetical protein HN954_01805 [bacterium]|nr:hypothetical protein [bacterium]MBT6832200.1 hypothetical protein [bacterium]MBT6996145.1 hypothetical protein [bacterium]MBT7772225.1 hypothetical protein [bacterium]
METAKCAIMEEDTKKDLCVDLKERNERIIETATPEDLTEVKKMVGKIRVWGNSSAANHVAECWDKCEKCIAPQNWENLEK